MGIECATPYYYRDIEVSGVPLHGTNLTQFEEGEQSSCNIKAEKYMVEVFPVKKPLNIIFMNRKR